MAEDTEESQDEKIVEMETPEGGQQEELTTDQKIDAIIQQAASVQALHNLGSGLGKQIENLALRMERLEAKEMDYSQQFINRIVEGTISRMKEELEKKSEESEESE